MNFLRRFLLVLVAVSAMPANAQDPTADARSVLDRPFHFLLKLPGWTVREFEHQSDVFSTWGQLVLEQAATRPADAAKARATVVRAGRNAGWRTGPASVDGETPDLRKYGVPTDAKPQIMRQSVGASGNDPPTRYLVRIWMSADSRRMVALIRVDGE